MPQIGLFDIPPQLISLVCNYLSPVDNTCLTLCNHSFMELAPHLDTLLGRSFATVLRVEDLAEGLRIILLTRLVRYLPQYYLCFACSKLHLWREVKLLGPEFLHRRCFNPLRTKRYSSVVPLEHSYYIYSDFKFHWIHLHLAMRRFYLGPSFGISTESLMHTIVKPMNIAYDPVTSFPQGDMGLISFEARICPIDPSSCVRIQHICLVQRDKVHQKLDGGECAKACRLISRCQDHCHFEDEIKNLFNDDDFYYLIKEGDHNSGKGPKTERRCHECNTAWKLQLREADKSWKDLGPDLDPLDYQWGMNLKPFSSADGFWEASDLLDHPRERFEMDLGNTTLDSSQTLSEEQMFLRNLSLLQRKLEG